jgi:hypothetical protein
MDGLLFMRRRDQKPMRTIARRFAPSWPAFSSLLTLLLCGCAALFGEKRSLVTTVHPQSSSPARFDATLSMSTRCIELDGFQRQAGNEWLRISVVNRGHSAFEMKNADGRFVPVTPGVPVELYRAEFPDSSKLLRMPVSGVQGRTPCEFEVEVSNPKRFSEGIRVYVFNSSAPM